MCLCCLIPSYKKGKPPSKPLKLIGRYNYERNELFKLREPKKAEIWLHFIVSVL